MTAPDPHPTRTRPVLRFIWHYVEMVIAMFAGMLLLAPLWGLVLPPDTGTDVDVLVMAADMVIGMAVWMRVRRHHWAAVAEMGVAMFAPFLILLVPYWFGVLAGHVVMSAGHVLMFVFMALAMLRRREEYTRHSHRLTVNPKWAKRAAVVLVALLVPGAVAAVNTIGKFADLYERREGTVSVKPVPRTHDPAKPTVALLTSSEGTNVADLLGPYEVLAGTGRVNTYIVAAGPGTAPLTGGLDLVPDLTFQQLAGVLTDHNDSLDAIMIPALQQPPAAEHAAINDWLRRQSAAGTLTVSVCRGAQAFAESGLLDGRTATSHWLRLAGLRAAFPQVKWVAGTRYVDDGNVISTAGVLSGVDGALRILERLVDGDTARAAADRVHWRHYSPGTAGSIPESAVEPLDAVVGINSSYLTGPSTIGVQVVEGVGELELASAFISYTEHAMVGRTLAIGEATVRSRHGLTFVPRASTAAGVGRLLVPGLDASRRKVAGTGGEVRPEYLHTTEEFAFDPVVRDIARTYDVRTALWTAKTLEYPVMDVELRGSAWPWVATAVPLVLALLGAAAAIGSFALVRRLRARTTTQPA
ncbi:DJ-1/PfpI family protein [Nonomuraea sp. NPDC048882]|uniref:DJ-1/PfpI family protein n=1 Tax=Nonomuraea sp. NPDC048882 TaxID=3154347 RepID=UPI0033D100F0